MPVFADGHFAENPPPDDGSFTEPPLPDDGSFFGDPPPGEDFFDPNATGDFDPNAVGDFNSDQFANFDSSAVGCFSADHFENFDPFAMGGFDASQVEHFDFEAVSGFGRDHLTGMALDALVGFEVDHVRNLDDEARQGFGDKVVEFDNFDLEVRGELIGDEAQRMGGFGSFEDLLKLFNDEPGDEPTEEELKALGWDHTFDPSSLDLGSEDIDVDDIFSETALANALAAFGI